MHNLHLYIITADTGEDACSMVESNIESWGGEDNYSTICHAISEDGAIYRHTSEITDWLEYLGFKEEGPTKEEGFSTLALYFI